MKTQKKRGEPNTDQEVYSIRKSKEWLAKFESEDGGWSDGLVSFYRS